METHFTKMCTAQLQAYIAGARSLKTVVAIVTTKLDYWHSKNETKKYGKFIQKYNHAGDCGANSIFLQMAGEKIVFCVMLYIFKFLRYYSQGGLVWIFYF